MRRRKRRYWLRAAQPALGSVCVLSPTDRFLLIQLASVPRDGGGIVLRQETPVDS
jgi:hypothetical protein